MLKVNKLWPGQHASLIGSLIIEKNFKNVTEIGVFRSKMLKTILRSEASTVIERYFAVDPWVPYNVHKEFLAEKYNIEKNWDDWYKYACKLMIYFPQLRVLRLGSVEAADLFPDGYFDLVFIDGDHRFEAVKNDINAWLRKIKTGGVICGHDYLERIPESIKPWVQVKEAVDHVFGSRVNILSDSVWAVEV